MAMEKEQSSDATASQDKIRFSDSDAIGHTQDRGSSEKRSSNGEAAGDVVAIPDFGPAPDGGLRAWLVAAAAASIFFSVLGFGNSFGVFQEYYMAHQLSNRTPDEISWIGSISVFVQFGAGLLSGPLFDRYGTWVIRPAAIIYILSIHLTSISTEYWHFMLAQGVLAGLAGSFLQVPAFASVSQYFDKRRAAALGLVVSGSSIGGVVFPIALSKMLNDSSLGFGWSVRIMGFVVLPLLLFSSLALRPRLPSRKTNFFLPEVLHNGKFWVIVASFFLGLIGMFTPLFFLPVFAVRTGMSATLSSYLVAIINGASTFGRIIPGVLADRFGKINVLSVGSLACGAVVISLNWAGESGTAGLVGYSVAFGFASGTIISGASAAFTVCVDDARNMGTYMGMGMAVGGVASLIGPPVSGAMLHTYGGFLEVSIFSGVMLFAGGFVALSSKALTPQGLFGRV